MVLERSSSCNSCHAGDAGALLLLLCTTHKHFHHQPDAPMCLQKKLWTNKSKEKANKIVCNPWQACYQQREQPPWLSFLFTWAARWRGAIERPELPRARSARSARPPSKLVDPLGLRLQATTVSCRSQLRQLELGSPALKGAFEHRSPGAWESEPSRTLEALFWPRLLLD